MNITKITPTQQRFDYIYLLKFLAIILITNSHFKPIYTGSLVPLAFGGAMGCSIFFFVSGYTLALSKKDNFWKWIGRRYLRIYPTAWLYFLLTGVMFGEWHSSWQNWVFLNSTWFLSAIVTFYLLFFFVSKYLSKWYLHLALISSIGAVITYFCNDHSYWMIDFAFNETRLHWFYYFAFMLIGAWVRTNDKLQIKGNKWLLILLSVGCFVGTYGIKFICEKYPAIMNMQLLFPIMLIVTTLVNFVMARNCPLTNPYIYKLVIFVAGITLELYIVQSRLIGLCSQLEFPYRLLLVIVAIPVCAWILHRVMGWLVDPIIKKLK